MQNGAMKAWLDSSYLSGSNQSWIEQLYEDFLTDPDSVDANWRSMFQQLPGTGVKPDQFHSKTRDYFRRLAKDASRYTSSISDPDTNVKQVKVLQLINAYRFRGHQHANLDPLGLWKQERVADLDPAYHDLTEADFQESYNVGSFAIGKDTMKLGELIAALKQTYCGSIGAEYMHITSTEEKRWIQQRIESVAGKASFTAEEKKRFLSELTAAEGLERYLGAKFPGAKRFSLEGGDALIPMLKEMIRHAGKSGTREVVLGMAHRGRLNVLVNVLGKKPQDLFDEFAGKHKEHLGTGDVKYHMGFSSDMETEGGLVHWRWRLTVVAPRDRQPGGYRFRTRPSGSSGRAKQQQSSAYYHPRRRRRHRPGRGSGNSEHVQSPRLRSGRYRAHRYQQPGGLHDL